MLIERTPRPGASGEYGRVEVDVRVPGTQLARKVYFAPSERQRKIPRPHWHSSGHVLVCMAGRLWLAYRKPGEAVRMQEMIPGYVYIVPPRLPHQMCMEPGSVMASYFPATTWLSKEEELEELDEDWFP